MPHQRRTSNSFGFTLIEVLIAVAIIGVIAAIVMPNMIDALQKAKQKRTMTDQRQLGSAWMAWLTDHVQAAGAGAPVLDYPFGLAIYPPAQLETDFDGSGLLPTGEPAPVYLAIFPFNDAWGRPFTFVRGNNLLATHVMAIHSGARNGNPGTAAPEICNGSDGDTTHGFFDSRRFDCDIIWKDGFFAQAPVGAKMASPAP